MGGLVIRAFLIKNRAIAEKVRFLYFFATPTTGSDIARVLSAFSSSPQLAEVGRIDPSLADLIREWLNAEFPIPTYCGYERRPMFGGMFGQMIVDELSAMSQCNRRPDPINANHVEIVKPADRQDSPYAALLVAFRDVEARAAKDSAGSAAADQRVAQQQDTLPTPPPAAQPAPSTPPPSIHQHSTGPNIPNIIGDKNTVIINPNVHPQAPITTYDFNGAVRTRTPSGVSVIVGETTNVFRKLLSLAETKDWAGLRDTAGRQTQATPEWPTPYFFAGLAYANLGDIDRAIELVELAQQKAGGNPDYRAVDVLRKEIRDRTGR